ncbi:MAG: M20/M25/M40 family metallo-hydrolase, partial [Clostridia bacterium]|nr:M20/M25/M40 family metallo-hydrolase [Clostridia bacterium]
MNTDIWIDNHKDEIVKNLQELIKIKGVEDFSTSKENAPFGEGVRKTLDKALDIAGGLSLNTKDLNGYCGLIDAGSGDDMLGILCHLDVVPEGTGWDYGPYEAQIVDGQIFGGGTIDDKGPALAEIYDL